MIEKFLTNYDIKTYDEVQNLLKNESLNKKRIILEKAIKQAKHATNILRGQQTGVKRQYKGGMITEKTRDEKLNLTRGANNIDELYQISTTSAWQVEREDQ